MENPLGNTIDRLRGRGRPPKTPPVALQPEPPEQSKYQPPPPTVKVKVVQPDNVQKTSDGEKATMKLANTITEPNDSQLPSMTWLSRPMANWLSTQNALSVENIFADEEMPVTCPCCGEKFNVSLGYVDLPLVWEKNLYRRNMSIDNTHADRVGELARMQIVGGPEDEPMGFGVPQ